MDSEITLEALRSVPLFAGLDDKLAMDLRGRLTHAAVEEGTVLFREGESGDSMYLVQAGRVAISITDQDGKKIVLAELAEGDFFGEMALLDGGARSADALVVDPSQFAVLSRDEFLSFINSSPLVALELLVAMTNRLRRTDQLLTARVSRNVNEEVKARATLGDRAADLIASFGGSWAFIIFSVLLIAIWICFNSVVVARGFDPAPFSMLNLLLAIIAGMQAPIIMMSQNRQGSKDRVRADLDYQVNLKNELSLGEVLRRLDVLESERLPNLTSELRASLGREPCSHCAATQEVAGTPSL